MKTLAELNEFINAHPPNYDGDYELIAEWKKELKEHIDSLHLKSYILIHEDVDLGHAINSAAHASLQMYLRHKDEPWMQEWAQFSFRKVTCKVTDKEFQKAKKYEGYEIVTEEHLDQKEVALIFFPRPKTEWPKFFNHLKLYA